MTAISASYKGANRNRTDEFLECRRQGGLLRLTKKSRWMVPRRHGSTFTTARADAMSDRQLLAVQSRYPNDTLKQTFAIATHSISQDHTLSQAFSFGRRSSRQAARQSRMEDAERHRLVAEYERKQEKDTVSRLRKACPVFEKFPVVVKAGEFATHVRVCGPTDDEIAELTQWLHDTRNQKHSLGRHMDNSTSCSHKAYMEKDCRRVEAKTGKRTLLCIDVGGLHLQRCRHRAQAED